MVLILANYAAFPARSDKQHRETGERYANLETKAQREEFVREHACRWTEFARLPYFDLVCMVVIDPMHNLILGKQLGCDDMNFCIDI